MKAKLLSLFGLSILVFMFLIGFTSAFTLAASPISVSLSTEGSSTTIDIINSDADGNFNITSSDPTTVTVIDFDSNQAVFTITSTTGLLDVDTATFQVTLTSVDEDFALGTHSGTLSISGVNVTNDTITDTLGVTLNYVNTELCEYNNLEGHLRLIIDDINVDGFGDDETWFPLDEIEIDIEIENRGNEDDIDDIVLEWGLYDSDAGRWIIDDKESKFDIKDGDDEIITINFKLDDVDDFEDQGDYMFYVWATGEDQELDGNETCVSASEAIEIEIESDFVVLDDIQSPSTVQCGEEVQLLADVWNIGDDDQDEVTVYISSTGLGLSEVIDMGDIDKFDNSDSPLDFIFIVPADAEEKTHIIRFTIYDEDNDVYENTNDDESIFNIPLKVEGGCALEVPAASVTANLETEEAKAGEELVVKITLTNLEDEAVIYNINLAEYSSWASLASLDLQVMTLSAGASVEILATFSVNEDVSGEQTFDIEVLSGNQVVVTQPAKVVIEGKGRGITGSSIRDNPYVWGIGIINIILIIVIVIVAIRLARK